MYVVNSHLPENLSSVAGTRIFAQVAPSNWRQLVFLLGFLSSIAGGVALYRLKDDEFTLAVGDRLPIDQDPVDAVIYKGEDGSLGTALQSLMSDASSEWVGNRFAHQYPLL